VVVSFERPRIAQRELAVHERARADEAHDEVSWTARRVVADEVAMVSRPKDRSCSNRRRSPSTPSNAAVVSRKNADRLATKSDHDCVRVDRDALRWR
jgi:hypothetical protein